MFTIWGGTRCPILPVEPDGTIDAEWLQVAKAIDPAILVDFTSPDGHASAWNHAQISRWPAVPAQPLTDYAFWNPHPIAAIEPDELTRRIWYYLAEAAGLQVWLVNARDVRHLPGRGKSDREDCVWLCKLNERGMLRRSFVPPQQIRDLRALTRLRTHLVHDRTRHQNRIEKILEDALLKTSSLISDLIRASGRRMRAALVHGERSPRALAALGDCRLKATPAQLEAAPPGRVRDIHALEPGLLPELSADLTLQ